MDYRELEPPEALRGLVKAGWTLAVPHGRSWVRHRAMPDGCVEIIRRLAGRSRWGGAQPEAFVAGLITGPAELEFEAGSRFAGLRLWPWAWNAIGRTPARDLVDRWAGLAEAAPGFVMPVDPSEAMAILASVTLDRDAAAMSILLPRSRSVDELARSSGRPRRWLQRWFARNVGVPPRLYLRLLRFQETLAGLQESAGTLADQAAAHGFADQAHMAREFRAIAGAPAGETRSKAKGPFV